MARLYTDGSFEKQVAGQFEGDFRLKFHLAPPAVAARDPATGRLVKREFGPWMMPAFRVLARLKHLRGTRWDVFGHSAERRTERRLIADYVDRVEALLAGLTADNHTLAVAIAEVPDRIRGFGHVKGRNVEAAEAEVARLMAEFGEGRPARAAAAE